MQHLFQVLLLLAIWFKVIIVFGFKMMDLKMLILEFVVQHILVIMLIIYLLKLLMVLLF